jgi:hypothetical protein
MYVVERRLRVERDACFRTQTLGSSIMCVFDSAAQAPDDPMTMYCDE